MDDKMALFVFLTILLFMDVTHGSTRPNIIFILADDLGWNDVSFHGSKQIPTPNLDTLAYDGILLGNYYVQPICTPTRGALLTGRHPIHTGLQLSVIVGSQPYGLGLNETILPQYLRKIGYRTHMVGKWHLGYYTPAHIPTARGFESHFGYYQGMEDYWDHTYQAGPQAGHWGLDFHRNGEILKTEFGRYSTELFTSEAERVIQQHNTSEPLFLYLAQQAVHSANGWSPLEAPDRYYERMSHIKDPRRRKFAAMVQALDDSVGNVTLALHSRGMLNNTIIVFSTDNGGPANGFDWNCASNVPLRGLKATLWEGGVRGTGFLWSTLLQRSRYTSQHMMQVEDWLPTLLSAAGYDMQSLSVGKLDGIDQWSVLSHNADPVRTEMLHNIEDGQGEVSLRMRDYKLVYSREGYTPHYDKWYPPLEGGSQVDTSTIVHSWHATDSVSVSERQRAAAMLDAEWWPRQKRGNSRDSDESEAAPEHLFESPLRTALSELGRPPLDKETPLVVECGPRPANATSCDVSKAPCVFDVTSDPCEYHDLAPNNPHLVARLLARAQDYRATAVPPANLPEDPRGLPSQLGGVWRPWRQAP